MNLRYKILLSLFLISVVILYFFMYQWISKPNDELGHSIGMFFYSIIWSLIVFAILLAESIGSSQRLVRRAFFGLILMLPAVWLLVSYFFTQILLFRKIGALHPDTWGQQNRLPDLASDGILLVLIVFGLGLIGLWIFLKSISSHSQKNI